MSASSSFLDTLPAEIITQVGLATVSLDDLPALTNTCRAVRLLLWTPLRKQQCYKRRFPPFIIPPESYDLDDLDWIRGQYRAAAVLEVPTVLALDALEAIDFNSFWSLYLADPLDSTEWPEAAVKPMWHDAMPWLLRHALVTDYRYRTDDVRYWFESVTLCVPAADLSLLRTERCIHLLDKTSASRFFRIVFRGVLEQRLQYRHKMAREAVTDVDSGMIQQYHVLVQSYLQKMLLKPPLALPDCF
ncbi:hypothetical protein HDU88_002516 [Geranomyces variabilis]|nr:hypothetical protein HDU88_002516 [Geranomyces variabilis]